MFCGARYGASPKGGISGSLVPALSNRGLCVPALCPHWLGLVKASEEVVGLFLFALLPS
jgi:hypothetical protein